MAETVARMIVHSSQPLNAEPRLPDLRRSFVTPQELFYVRTHGTLPAISAAGYRLTVKGRVSNSRDYSLDELRSRFVIHTVMAVVQCAGNRRAGMTALRPVDGHPWQAGAIGNASWTGVRLADVLRDAQCAADKALHVEFTSCDAIEMQGERFNYAVSIPIEKALSPEVLLAWEMNGTMLTREHGFPLRVVVPGYAGVRSAKWLSEIHVRNSPSDCPMQQKDYKLFPPTSGGASPDWSHAVTINTMPLNAAICEPEPHANLVAGPCSIRGYAIAPAGSNVTRVEVSTNGGHNWNQAQLESQPNTPWSWTLWQIALDLPIGEHELVARAWDEAERTQPSSLDQVWNFKGYLNASWHRIPVRVR